MHTNKKDPSDIDEAKKLGACGFCSSLNISIPSPKGCFIPLHLLGFQTLAVVTTVSVFKTSHLQHSEVVKYPG